MEIGKKDLIQEKLKQLVNIFIFHQSFDSVGPPPDSQGAPCSSMEELKLIVAMHNKLEEQTDAGLRYGLFDAIFGGIVEVSGERRSEIWSGGVEIILCAGFYVGSVAMGIGKGSRGTLFDF